MTQLTFESYKDYAAWYAEEFHGLEAATVETVGQHVNSWTCEVSDVFGLAINVLVWKEDNEHGFSACEVEETQDS